MELQSISSDEDNRDDRTNSGDTGPQVKKESKSKREEELRIAYSNPFKPQNIEMNKMRNKL